MTARELILAWARSPGFAAIHNGAATDEQIADDLLGFMAKHFMTITPNTGALDQQINAVIRRAGLRSWDDTRQMTVRDLLGTQGFTSEAVARILAVTGRHNDISQIPGF